jgi:alkylation response protein AidB-like acyl-CoA dehydrogenase
MNLEFSEDQKFIQQTARDYLNEYASLEVCRAVLESEKPYDTDLWKGVAEMGWLGATVPEEFGGAGLGYLELVLIAEELEKQKYLPRLCSGELIGSFAIAEGSGDLETDAVATAYADGRLDGEKLPVLDGDAAGLAVVLAMSSSGPSLVLVDLEGEGVTRAVLQSFDPSRSQAKLSFSRAPAEQLGEEGQGAELTSRLLDRAAVLMGFEQIGGAERTLELTRDFTMSRYTFGRPVASYQALKHRLADLYAAIQIATSNGYYAAWALSEDNDELPVSACSTRVAASEAFCLGAEEMIQMHGGVGFTWEYDCHLFFRRAELLSLALGSPSAWREKLIQRLEADDAG